MAQDYIFTTEKDIEQVLRRLKRCLVLNNFTIALNENRRENIEFLKKYNINQKKQKDILRSLTVYDFCYAARNKKQKYRKEILYIFAPKLKLLNNIGEPEKIKMYIKVNFKEYEDDYMIVISFHKLNRPITYMIKRR